jgi:hypothetical protein
MRLPQFHDFNPQLCMPGWNRWTSVSESCGIHLCHIVAAIEGQGAELGFGVAD